MLNNKFRRCDTHINLSLECRTLEFISVKSNCSLIVPNICLHFTNE